MARRLPFPVRDSLSTMTAATPSPSGLAAVDRQWGGLAAGRTYLLVGRAGAGRSALALQTVRAAADAGQRCLVISPRSPDDLVEVGHDVGLDLAAAHTAGTLRLLRIPKAADLAARGPEGLAKSYRDLVALVASDNPARVVIEDFTPLVQFDTFERFHDAFAGLVGALREQGVTLVIGLGDPANDASRRLLDVVEGLVDGTIRLGAGGDLVLGTPGRADYPSNDGASVEAEPPPAPEPPAAVAPTTPAPLPAPVAVPPPADPEPPVLAPDPTLSEPSSTAPASPDHSTTFAPGPTAAPESSFAPPFAPETSAPTVSPEPSAQAFAPEPPSASAPPPSASAEPPYTDVVAPPPPDPSLLAPSADAFGNDAVDSLFAQGYLADSRGSALGAPPAAPAMPSLSAVPPGLPAFAPLGGSAPDPGIAFRAALDSAFASRGTAPFVVIALRMDPAVPDAAHFDTVEAGLRSGLRPADRLLVDASRKRAAVVLPDSAPDAAQTLFGSLQAHLRATLGAEAERVLQSVAAVTVPDGQPFQTSAELVSYAFEG